MNVPGEEWIQYGGLGIAVLGFTITRLFVAETVQTDTATMFLVVGLLPLLIGLGMAVYGVTLAVGTFSTGYVNTVMRWSFAGTGTMLFVFGLTAVDELLRTGGLRFFADSRILVGNVLLGGAVGGMLIGHRVAENRQQRRAIDRQSNRALFVNRLLRHEVINAATIIDGYAGMRSDEGGSEATAAIRESVGRIEETVDEIGTIAQDATGSKPGRIDVTTVLEREIETFEHDRSSRVEFDCHADDMAVGGEGLHLIFRELLKNAHDHGTGSSVGVDVDIEGPELCIAVRNDGPELPATQRALLEDGVFPEYDDPTTGFGLQVVRLLVDRYGGRISVADSEATTITVRLPRDEADRGLAAALGVTFPNLYRAGAAGIVAGVAMGIVYSVATGLFPVIGALYGVEIPVVGWVTHLFHSVVFALLFAVGCSRLAGRDSPSETVTATTLGAGWGIILWLVAAGVAMPLWLRLVGIEATVPNLTAIGFVGHLVWGVTLGLAYVLFQRVGRSSV